MSGGCGGFGTFFLPKWDEYPPPCRKFHKSFFVSGGRKSNLLPTKSGRSGRYSECYCYFCNDETGCHPASFRFRPDFVAARPLCDPFDYRDDLFVALQHVDSIFIGHGVGPIAISGVALSMPLMNIASAFGSLIGIGAAALTSIRLGQGRREAAEGVLGNVVLLNFLVAALLRP